MAKKKTTRRSKKVHHMSNHMKVESKKEDNFPLALMGLIINLFLPGLGTVVGGKTRKGIIQFAFFMAGVLLFLISLPLLLIVVGLPFLLLGCLIILVSWIWALITSVQLISQAH